MGPPHLSLIAIFPDPLLPSKGPSVTLTLSPHEPRHRSSIACRPPSNTTGKFNVACGKRGHRGEQGKAREATSEIGMAIMQYSYYGISGRIAP